MVNIALSRCVLLSGICTQGKELNEARADIEKWKIAASLEGLDFVEEYNRADLKTIEMFLQKLSFYEVNDAAEVAYSKFLNRHYYKFRYFCGICWKIIKGEH
jgi:hypothetical protein